MGVLSLTFSDMKNYVVHSKLGRGKYSHVFEGTEKSTGKRVAIKVLIPIRKDKIKREYHIHSSLNHPNVGKMVGIVQCPYLKTTSFIFEYCPHVDFRELYPALTLADIKNYAKQLFKVQVLQFRVYIICTQRESCIEILNRSMY